MHVPRSTICAQSLRAPSLTHLLPSIRTPSRRQLEGIPVRVDGSHGIENTSERHMNDCALGGGREFDLCMSRCMLGMSQPGMGYADACVHWCPANVRGAEWASSRDGQNETRPLVWGRAGRSNITPSCVERVYVAGRRQGGLASGLLCSPLSALDSGPTPLCVRVHAHRAVARRHCYTRRSSGLSEAGHCCIPPWRSAWTATCSNACRYRYVAVRRLEPYRSDAGLLALQCQRRDIRAQATHTHGRRLESADRGDWANLMPGVE